MNQARPLEPAVVLFDYGGVLAEEGFVEGLAVIAAANCLDSGKFFGQVEKIIYDCGYLTGANNEAGFWAKVRRECGISGSDAELTGQILRRFMLRSGMLAMVRGLQAQGVRTAILSDQTDWLEQLDQRDHFLGEFDPVLNSFYLGHSKREAETFGLALARLGVAAGQVLFVDDNAAHIGRAAALGLQVHHFGDEVGFAAELARRGLWSDQSDQSDKSDPSDREAKPI